MRAALVAFIAAMFGIAPPSTALALVAAQQGTVEYREDLRLGRVDGSGPDVFARIVALEVDRQGRIYVLDDRNSRVVVFGSDGRLVRAFGRQGQGPGEFESPIGLDWLQPGELVVIDARQYSVFDTNGVHLRSHRRPSQLLQYPFAGGAAEGTICDVSMAPDEISFLVTRRDSVLATFTTARPPAPRVEITPGRRVGTPYAPTIGFQVDCAKRAVWKFHSTDSSAYLLGFGKDTLRRLAHGLPRRDVSSADRMAAIQSVAQSSGASVAALDRVTPRIANYFVRAFVSRDGDVWLQPPIVSTAATPGFPYRVLDSSGRVSTVRLTPGLYPTVRPVIVDPFVYGVVTGANDVHFVVRLRRQPG